MDIKLDQINDPKLRARLRAAALQSFEQRLNHANPPRRTLPDTKPQRDPSPTLGCPKGGETQGGARTVVRIVGYRTRPLDPDNFSGGTKSLIDLLRHSSLLVGDEPWRIRLETEQVRVAHRKDERTEITIEYPAHDS